MKKGIILLILVIAAISILLGVRYIVKSYGDKYTPEVNSNTSTDKKLFLPKLFVANSALDKVSIEEVRGNKPMVINYWASWCPPCKMELPDFNKLFNKYREQVEFMFLSSSDGTRETIETASSYVKKQGYDFKLYYDLYDVGITLGLRSLPTTIFIAKDGSVASVVMGAISEKNLEKTILEMLK